MSESSEEIIDECDSNSFEELDLNPMDDIIISDSNHDKIIIINEGDKITSNILQLPEMCEAIGIRASQIEVGSPIFTDYGTLNNPIDIAKKEFFDRKTPVLLQRITHVNEEEGITYAEIFKVREMTYPIITKQ